MTKTVEYIAIGGAVVVVLAIGWSFVKPNPQIPVNSTPVQPSGTGLTDILTASIRGLVAGIGDSERTASNAAANTGPGVYATSHLPYRGSASDPTGGIPFWRA